MKAEDFAGIKKATFRGLTYRIVWRKPRDKPEEKRKKEVNSGCCDRPWTPKKAIFIAPAQDPIMILDTALHEGLHACIPDLDEAAVTETMNCLMRLILRMGVKVEFDPHRPLKERVGNWSPAQPQP